ncbi:glycosyltransferase family 2 protein [Mobiluncus mulieris]|uniref:glycosyltransferase family 2 protein n=1 Tax=Mobiluncus mulieris TaxID=2052 RepID=UPI00325BF183
MSLRYHLAIVNWLGVICPLGQAQAGGFTLFFQPEPPKGGKPNMNPTVRPNPEIRVVCVAYHSATQVRNLLESLPAATHRRVQAVVVDNSEAPDAELQQICKTAGAAYVSRPDNPGFGVASNLGVALRVNGVASEPWVVLANPDLRFLPDSLDALLDTAAAHPQAAVVGPALVDQSGTRYPTGRSFPYFSVGIGHALFGWWWPGNPWTQAYWGRAWRGNENCTVDWVSGACQVWRRADWRALHGFDPSFFMYFEDADLCLKARRRLGKTALLAAGVAVIHDQGASTGNVTAGTGTSCIRRNASDAQTPLDGSNSRNTFSTPNPPVRSTPNPRALRAHHESTLIFLRHLYPQIYWRPLLALIGLGLKLRLAILRRK